MEWKELIDRLPTQPRNGMKEWVKERFTESELGGHKTIFYRDSVYVEPIIKQTMTPEDWREHDKASGYHHAARCICTACGERYVTGWQPKHGDRYGIRVNVGDDGTVYDGYVAYDDNSREVMPYNDGDLWECPYCSERTILRHKSAFKNGRTYQLMITSVETVGKYGVLMTWLAVRRIYPDGSSTFEIVPREAVALDDRRRMQRFTHAAFGVFGESQLQNWETRQYTGEDLSFRKYYDYGSINKRKCGAAVWDNVPDVTGTTIEKTGIAEYVQGCDTDLYPFAYLKYWHQHPNIENIIKSPWRSIIDSEICEAAESNYHASLHWSVESVALYFDEVKPHKMLGMTKEDYRWGLPWDWQDLYEWQQYNGDIGTMSVPEFQGALCYLGTDGVAFCNEKMLEGYEHFELREIVKYISKQELVTGAPPEHLIQTLDDYRDMLYRVGEGHITMEQFFPRDLQAAHDRLMEQVEAKENAEKIEAFRAVVEKYKYLEYSDGALCAILPTCERDLIDEGKTLRHCVGGYGRQFCAESDVIFFIRHARRPERSYYTLDIRFNKGKPTRVQLHGYGNEHHGDHKQYKHGIPQKVQDFVDKWEQEILLPRWMAAQAKKNKEAKQDGATVTDAA